MGEHSPYAEKIFTLIEEGKVPLREDCALHGKRLNALENNVKQINHKIDGINTNALKSEKQIDELHGCLFRNGFMKEVGEIRTDTARALTIAGMNNKLMIIMISAIVVSTISILIKGL